MAKKITFDTSSSNDLKVACQTQIKKHLNKSGYTESHFNEDLVLACGYIGALACLADFAYSYKYGFNETIWASYYSVSLYAITYLISLFYSTFIIKNTFYYGTSPSKSIRVQIASSSSKYSDVFTICVTAPDSSKSASSSNSFGKYFYANGELSSDAIALEIDSLLAKCL
ncbi:hypothetical protein AYI68_g5372 [Smittium mucronatum]|uniref:Signal peptidase complex subunit 2 n=1 Tax=Smittium mucronatum TaxID=133383 RepID=A0A1R0GUH0_9FUNG|nr:hypothetical protein AYI68_g5372 [Smittium mucronatum]